MRINKSLGSILMIAGTTLGAGMLALPMVSAGQGFIIAFLLLIATWALMLYGALITLEVNLRFSPGASFSTLGRQTLGRSGQFVINLSMVFLFYCLTAAYISGGADFLQADARRYTSLMLTRWQSALIFTVLLASLVVWKTAAVDLANRFLLFIKMAAFFAVTFLMVPHVDVTQLKWQQGHADFIWMSLPIFFTAFGFHGSIPSIVKYVGPHPKTLRRIFFIGSLLPLLLYGLWELVSLGILAQTGPQSFQQLAHEHGSVADFIQWLANSIHNPWVTDGIHFFTDVAMTTSFLGVSLGLFDFFADLFNTRDTKGQRLLMGIITFLPPLLFALLYPRGFITALGFAAIPLALLAIILPSLMALNCRKQRHQEEPYRAAGGMWGLSLMMGFGCLIIVLQCLSVFHKLPVFN